MKWIKVSDSGKLQLSNYIKINLSLDLETQALLTLIATKVKKNKIKGFHVLHTFPPCDGDSESFYPLTPAVTQLAILMQ